MNGFSGLDISILILAATAVVGLGLKAVGDARQVALEDAREAVIVETANVSAPAGLPHLTVDASA